MIPGWKRLLWPVGAGLMAMMGLMTIYAGLVSWAEGLQHAVDLFWEDRFIVVPIVVGFGFQVGLYVILKKRLFVPVSGTGPSGVLTGAGGATSTTAMVACCAHHVTDALPILGMTAAATFLAEYRIALMLVGLGTTLVGIVVMLVILLKERRRAFQQMAPPLRDPA